MANTMTLEQVRNAIRDAPFTSPHTHENAVWADAIDAAIKQREQDKRDAERYRWLRDNAGAWEASCDPGEWTKRDTGEKYKPRVYFSAYGTRYGGMFLDEAIDAAMAKESGND